MIYLLILFYLSGLTLYYDLSDRVKSKGLHKGLVLFSLILVAGLRYRLAPDSVYYAYYFENEVVDPFHLRLSIFKESRYQPLWILLNSFLKLFDSTILFQLVCASIFNISVFYFFERFAKKFFSSILLYVILCYVYFNMEIIRESLAIAMFLVSTVKLDQNKLAQFYLFIFLAFMFHHFAIFLIVVPFLVSKLISFRSKLILSGILTLIVYNFALYLFSLDISSLVSFAGKFDLTIYDVDREMTVFGYLYNILRFIPSVLFLVYYSRFRSIPFLNIDKSLLYSFILFYIVIIVLRTVSIPFLDRVSNYFIFFVILISTSTIHFFISKIRILSFRPLVLLSSYFLVLVFYVWPMTEVQDLFDSPEYKRYFPYYSVFSKGVDNDRERIIQIEAKE